MRSKLLAISLIAALSSLSAGCLAPQDALDGALVDEALQTNDEAPSPEKPGGHSAGETPAPDAQQSSTRTDAGPGAENVDTPADSNDDATDDGQDGQVEPVEGDLNGDGVLDEHDILEVLKFYGLSGPADGDLNGDGQITISDLGILLGMLRAAGV